jgi:hypothetical protein
MNMTMTLTKGLARSFRIALAVIALLLASTNGVMADIVATIQFSSDDDSSATDTADSIHITEPTLHIDVTKTIDEPTVHSRDFLLLQNYNWVTRINLLLSDTGDTVPGDQIILHNVGADAYVYMASDDEAGKLVDPSIGMIPPPQFDIFPAGGGPYMFQDSLFSVPEPSPLIQAVTAALIGLGTAWRHRRRS